MCGLSSKRTCWPKLLVYFWYWGVGPGKPVRFWVHSFQCFDATGIGQVTGTASICSADITIPIPSGRPPPPNLEELLARWTIPESNYVVAEGGRWSRTPWTANSRCLLLQFPPPPVLSASRCVNVSDCSVDDSLSVCLFISALKCFILSAAFLLTDSLCWLLAVQTQYWFASAQL